MFGIKEPEMKMQNTQNKHALVFAQTGDKPKFRGL
jgi:hypothetical protein